MSDDFIEPEKFIYEFSLTQAKEMCYLIRKNRIQFSEQLNNFCCEIENYVYSSMTIDEAERFFNEN